jgi:hypothetical protein
MTKSGRTLIGGKPSNFRWQTSVTINSDTGPARAFYQSAVFANGPDAAGVTTEVTAAPAPDRFEPEKMNQKRVWDPGLTN